MLIEYSLENIKTYNSYSTVMEANTYFNTQFGTIWHTIEDDLIKEKLLINASQLIDTNRLIGVITNILQNLKFPRNTLLSDGSSIPKQIKIITYELALWIYSGGNRFAERGVGDITIQGAIRVKNVSGNIPLHIERMLRPFIERIHVERG